jgi:hypothetical protein
LASTSQTSTRRPWFAADGQAAEIVVLPTPLAGDEEQVVDQVGRRRP